MTSLADSNREHELLRAARRLLGQTVNLDAVHVLHGEVVRSLGEEAASLPARYASVAEARTQQQRLQALVGKRTSQPPHGVLQFFQRQPWWAPRAAVAGLLILLTLRYAWAVNFRKNWARQNPEGNWISRYYAGANFEGNPMLRYDVGINVDFSTGGPVRRLAKDNFSIRWDTCIVVAREVTLPLTLQADDRAQLFVDGVSQIQIEPGPGVATASVSLKPGVRHVRVDFVERKGTALVRLDGLQLEGTDDYVFQRPRVNGAELTCDRE